MAAALGAVAPPPAARAIVGGDEADPGAWPWQVALFLDGETYCGGALLTLDVVVTAAHCTDGIAPDRFTVVGGTHDLSDPGAERREVARVDQHEDYDAELTQNDIAVLVLAEPFAGDGGAKPVAVPSAATSLALTRPAAPVVVTGYGAVSETGDLSDRLLEAEVVVVGDGACRRGYAEDGDDVDVDTQVCAGVAGGHVDACYGDSGGPLVAPADERRGSWFLVGIVSWGAGCGRPGRPTVYTEVSAFADWLGQHGATSTGRRFTADEPLRLPVVGGRGKATRYPSTVEVAGFGVVSSAAVELHGLSHARPADLDVWLQAPDGTVVTVLSDVGGDHRLEAADVVVEDGPAAAADVALPVRVAPTDREADREGKGGAPTASLAALAGVDGDGEWRLYVADDADGASGRLESWSLVLR